MIFIDSWVWIEFFAEEKKSRKAEEVIEKLESEKGIISSIVLLEVRYRIMNKFRVEKADKIINLIESFDNLKILPLNGRIAKYAADLRYNYYKRGDREISYGDSINLAVAISSGCEKLYSGDPDFEDIREIDTEVI